MTGGAERGAEMETGRREGEKRKSLNGELLLDKMSPHVYLDLLLLLILVCICLFDSLVTAWVFESSSDILHIYESNQS